MIRMLPMPITALRTRRTRHFPCMDSSNYPGGIFQRTTDGSVPHANDGGPEFINLSSAANHPPLWFSLPIPFIARNTVITGKGKQPSLPLRPHAHFPGFVSVGLL